MPQSSSGTAPREAAQASRQLGRCLRQPPKDRSRKPQQEELVLPDVQASTPLPFQRNPPKGPGPPSSRSPLNTRTGFSCNARSSMCWHPGRDLRGLICQQPIC